MFSGRIDKELLLPADDKGREVMLKHIEEKHGITPTRIARSILSREILMYKIGEGKRSVLIAAAHHALESVTANIALLLVDILLSNYENGAIKGNNCKLLLSQYSFFILPCVNPDGIELRYHGLLDTPLYDRQRKMSGGDFTAWQANARGVDLNHNYDYRFAEYKALERQRGITAGASLFSGESAESEPEVRGVANLVRTVMPSAVVSLHSQGEEIYAMPNNRVMQRRAERLASMCGYLHSTPEDTALYGGLCDYTGSLGIPSFTYEVGKGKNPLPESCIPSVFARIAESLILLPIVL